MNVLSLFDGISAGMVALERAGIKVDNYYASEIDPYAIKVSESNYPNIIRLGDVTKWKEWNLPKIDLVIGGSPCFVAGTLILTKKDGYKRIENILVGDEVLSHTGSWRTVLRVGSKEATSTRIIKGYGNIGLETTDFLKEKHRQLLPKN